MKSKGKIPKDNNNSNESIGLMLSMLYRSIYEI